MAIKVMGIHHHAVRIDAGNHPLDTFQSFYSDVLGLEHDTGRPSVSSVPGLWINVGDVGQIHLMGGQFPSTLCKVPGEDPVDVHVALAVEDVAAAKAELERLGVHFWSLVGVAGPETEQLFVRDPAGNMIELHQYDKCRCAAANRGQ
jgi:catechol 2,3-dioxygenase-like lactoylglutathione lyase family enzyme